MRKKNKRPYNIKFDKIKWQNEREEQKLSPEAEHNLRTIKIMMFIFVPLGLLFGCFLNLDFAFCLDFVISLVCFLILYFYKKNLKVVCFSSFIWLTVGILLGRFLVLRTLALLWGN